MGKLSGQKKGQKGVKHAESFREKNKLKREVREREGVSSTPKGGRSTGGSSGGVGCSSGISGGAGSSGGSGGAGAGSAGDFGVGAVAVGSGGGDAVGGVGVGAGAGASIGGTVGSGKRWNFAVDYNDHFETPPIAYADLAPLLRCLSAPP
eukprot:CAMPEP_0173357794 /NCGR_PEP_ID=MMETSP1144-20121109/19110_1 /TAXON_ID=483371 /ORGANISM="non described non described, Strain CCMP2298" /LENGTH=149 /DNA_ID=CAMNT_0014306837 /DNA_START=120 /DNA_END=567 /DNA_ORIENTATION=+